MENQSPAHTGLTGLLEQLENVGTDKCDTCEISTKSLYKESLYEVKILHQPQGNQGDYKFRHESEKQHAMPIKGRVKKNPAIYISNPPPCPAEVWVQCVDYNYDPKVHIKPTPNPNGIFIKTEKERYPPTGVSIIDNGEKDGVVKIHIDNLADQNGKITFEGGLRLALFKTEEKDVWKHLSTRNEINCRTPDGISHLNHVKIPANINSFQAIKRIDKEIDTSRVKLCFQVFLYPQTILAQNETAFRRDLGIDPVCSETIAEENASPPLQIDDISVNISPETGLDKVIILCSKIEEPDENKIKAILTFKDMKGEETEIEICIPQTDVHLQSAIRFKCPAYPQVAKELDSQSHAHAKVQLGKYSENKVDYSNPVDLIYFPTGKIQKHGRCIGAWNNTVCKYASKMETQSENLKGISSLGTVPKTTEIEPKGLTYSWGQIIPPNDVKKNAHLIRKDRKRPHHNVDKGCGQRLPEKELAMSTRNYLEEFYRKDTDGSKTYRKLMCADVNTDNPF